MKPLLWITASTVALASLAACTSDKAPVAQGALDCPTVQGDLTRTGIAPDRKSCTYRTSGGSEVLLQLVATGGDPTGALKAIEDGLMAPIAAETAKAEAAAKAGQKADGKLSGSAAESASKAAEDAAKDAAALTPDTDPDENVKVHLPGLHVETHDGADGKETARINMPGIHIVADDSNDSADIRIGGMHILAQDDEATIRMYRDVRLKGEAMSRERRGLRATFIYTGKKLPQGYRMVGYEAAGPKVGPITVAVVKANVATRTHDEDVYKDVKRLVRRNSGA